MAGPQTILLKGDFAQYRGSATAGGTITPGMLLTFEADGDVIAHATAGGTAGEGVHGMMFAIEDSLQGRTIDDNYSATEKVEYHIAQKGDEIYVLLATANNATPATRLTSNGNGAMKVANGTTDQNLMVPVETLNNTSGSNARLRARVL